jgi:hypothetical protein
VAAGPGQIKDTLAAFADIGADIGADELILNPTVGDPERSPASRKPCCGGTLRVVPSKRSKERES